jgi:hypothetical protein
MIKIIVLLSIKYKFIWIADLFSGGSVPLALHGWAQKKEELRPSIAGHTPSGVHPSIARLRIAIARVGAPASGSEIDLCLFPLFKFHRKKVTTNSKIIFRYLHTCYRLWVPPQPRLTLATKVSRGAPRRGECLQGET